MGKEEIAEKLKNPLTIRAFIIGLILCLFGNLISMIGLGFAPFIAVASSLTDKSITTILIMAVLSLAVTPLLKARGFSSGELILIYVMSMVGLFAEKSWGVIAFHLATFQDATIGTQALQFTPDIWIPKDPSVWQPMMTGGAAVPWSAWMMPMFYWCILQLAFLGIGMSFGLILTHSIIDVERLPFPYTQVITPLTSEPKKSARERVNMPLLVLGVIIGFLIQGTYGFFQHVIPAFPDFWPRGMWGTVGYDLGPIVGPNIFRNQHLVLTMDNLPSMIALFFLMPTKVVGSALLVHFILGNLIPYIEVGMGILTNVASFGLYDIAGWIIAQWGTLLEPTGIQLFTVTGLGFPVGFVIAYLFFTRKEMMASLRAAIEGRRTSQFNDRILWIAFILSIIIYVVMASVVGIPLITSIIFVFMSFVFLIIAIRLRGEIIMDIPPLLFCTVDTAVLSAGPQGTAESYMSVIMFGQIQSQGFLFTKSPVFMPLEGIRLLESSGEKWKYQGLVIGAIIATVIGIFFNYISYVWGSYTYGILTRWNTPEWGDYIEDIYTGISPGTWAFGVVPMRIWPETVIGIIVVMVVTALNSMFLWWPIHPLGLMLGGYLGWAMWFQALLAFILRVVVLKVGGGKLYNKFVQVMLGILIGYAMIQVLYVATLLV